MDVVEPLSDYEVIAGYDAYETGKEDGVAEFCQYVKILRGSMSAPI